MSEHIVLAVVALALGVAMVAKTIPPAWTHGTALPRDPETWRSSWVNTGWLLCIAGAATLVWAVVGDTVMGR